MSGRGRIITNRRNIRFRSAVLGEGQTEQYYLKHLKTLKGYNYAIRPRLFSSITIGKAQKLISELLREGYDLVVYFVDYDKILEDNKVEQFNRLKQLYEKKNVLICESLPSIEYWFLMHYQLTTREFRNADELVQRLRSFIPDFSKARDFLENPLWVENMCGDGQFGNALDNARRVLQQKESDDVSEYFPFTKVHLGIERLEELKNRKE